MPVAGRNDGPEKRPVRTKLLDCYRKIDRLQEHVSRRPRLRLRRRRPVPERKETNFLQPGLTNSLGDLNYAIPAGEATFGGTMLVVHYLPNGRVVTRGLPIG